MAWGYKCLVARTLLGAVRETAATGCSQSQGLKLCFQTMFQTVGSCRSADGCDVLLWCVMEAEKGQSETAVCIRG